MKVELEFSLVKKLGLGQVRVEGFQSFRFRDLKLGFGDRPIWDEGESRIG